MGHLSQTFHPPHRQGRPGEEGWAAKAEQLEESMGGGKFPSEIETYHRKINKLVLGREPWLNRNHVSNQMLTVSDSLKLPNTLLNREWKGLS